MHMIYMMRYSYFGQSGWRSEAATNPDLLFAPQRLEERDYFLRKIALASLRDQTDEDFELIVLSSTLMPERYQTRLKEVCSDMLGKRAHVVFREPSSASVMFTRYRKRNFAKYPFSNQIVLDDDDAVAVDFTATLRAEAENAILLRPEDGPDYVFISHPRGITARFEQGTMELMHRLVPATNLGLSVVAPTHTRRNPFAIAHRKILERRPVRVNYTMGPQYIRAVHGSNDSKAQYGTDMVSEEDMPRMLKAFPLLKDLGRDWSTLASQPIEKAA